MKRALIVDDEILVRIGIRTMLEGTDYEVVAEATGGRDALQLADRLAPDIVLTDLVMADGDGLELVRKLRERSRGRDEAIVVLSCKNDFELVREAMRAGADDYVFKLTLKSEELLEAFGRAISKHPGVGTPRDVQPDAFAAAVGSILRGEKPASLTVGVLERPYRILFLSLGPSADGAAFTQLVRELARTDSSCLAAASCGSRAVFALKYEGRSTAWSSFSLSEEYARRYLGRRPCGGLSGPCASAANLPGAIGQATCAADAAFREGGGLVFSDDAARDRRAGLFKPEAYASACAAIRRALEALDVPATLAASSAALSVLREATDRDSDRLRSLAVDLFSPFKERARALGFDLDGSADMPSPDKAALEARDLEELSAFLPPFVEAFAGEAAARIGLRKEIAETRRWVLADLARPYTVEAAAERAGMSPSHFAHVWKREFGSSFIDSVNAERMERARELLNTTAMLVRQVADAVGIESLNHFGALYKRRFGETPNETRHKRLQK